MTKGPHRIVLDQYLDTAAEGRLANAGTSWKSKARELKMLGDALGKAAQQAELRIGEQTLTGPALRAAMEKSSQSLIAKSEKLHAAGEALSQVGVQLSDARDQRDALADLGEKPPAYQAPPGTPGVEPTPEEIQAQAAASQARQNERSAWQTEYDKQEARSLALTREMDAAFLGAIPPMKEIHGAQDPTEPPPNVPSGPGGPYLPGTQAPPVTGGGGGGNPGGGNTGVLHLSGGNDDGDGDGGGKDKPNPTVITKPPTVIPEPPTTPTTTPTTPTYVPTEGPTSTVTGSSQNGITYQPTGAQVSAPTSTSAGSPGATAAAFGAAGGAGGLAGAVRPGAVPSSTSGSTPVRAIGSTGRAGSAGALSRSAATGSSAARGAATTGSPASRNAGSAARGTAAGNAAGRGGAGSRGTAAGSTSGSRSGGRGSSGARSAGAGSAGGRSGRKGERDRTGDRDSLVYDQDWLGDDDVAPGVLD